MAQEKKDDPNQLNEAPRQPFVFGVQPQVITVDYDLYAHFLEDADLTEDQKREFLQALWNIIVEFVSLGFGVHPAQQAQLSCGKLPATDAAETSSVSDDLEYSDSPIANEFYKAIGKSVGGEKGFQE